MSLSNGYYLIKHQRSGKVVSRHVREDRSLLPKRVLVFPEGAIDPRDRQWVIESLGGGNYHLANRGGTASVIEGKVYGNLLPSRGNDAWQVIPGPGPNTFLITNSDGLNWSVPNADDDEPQVVAIPSPDFFVIIPCEGEE